MLNLKVYIYIYGNILEKSAKNCWFSCALSAAWGRLQILLNSDKMIKLPTVPFGLLVSCDNIRSPTSNNVDVCSLFIWTVVIKVQNIFSLLTVYIAKMVGVSLKKNYIRYSIVYVSIWLLFFCPLFSSDCKESTFCSNFPIIFIIFSAKILPFCHVISDIRLSQWSLPCHLIRDRPTDRPTDILEEY